MMSQSLFFSVFHLSQNLRFENKGLVEPIGTSLFLFLWISLSFNYLKKSIPYIFK